MCFKRLEKDHSNKHKNISMSVNKKNKNKRMLVTSCDLQGNERMTSDDRKMSLIIMEVKVGCEALWQIDEKTNS